MCCQEWRADVTSVLRCSTNNASRLRQLYADISSKLIGRSRRRDFDADLYGSSSPLVLCEPGPFIRKFQERFTKELNDLCGVDGEALVNLGKVSRLHSREFTYFDTS